MLKLKDAAINESLISKDLMKYFTKKELTIKDTDYIVYHTNLKFNDDKFSVTIDVDGTEYTTIYYKIGTLNDESKAANLAIKLNEKSALSKLVTYYKHPSKNVIMGKISYLANKESFNGDYFVSLIERGLYNISIDSKIILTLPYVDKLL